jgi:hypothetical protein
MTARFFIDNLSWGNLLWAEGQRLKVNLSEDSWSSRNYNQNTQLVFDSRITVFDCNQGEQTHLADQDEQ